MISDFKSNNQNYVDLKTMIDEAKKHENTNLGMEVVQIAQEIRFKRELNYNKKDFMADHKSTVRNWQNTVNRETRHRRAKSEQMKMQVIKKKNMLEI